MTPPLHHRVIGSGPRVVLVHGFTQTGACWGPIPDALAGHFEVVLVDAPGHGGSTAVEADLEGTADLLTEFGPAHYVGYSMGGRMALHLAVRQENPIERLVLIGATPGIEENDERHRRQMADERLADRLLEIGVAAFLDEWLAQPMFERLPPDSECLRSRRANTAEGLARSLRRCGTGSQRSLWPELGHVSTPMLLVTGSADAKFTAIAAEMGEASGSPTTTCTIPGAGHAAHLEQPEMFVPRLLEFLR